jgi:NADPH:quinone reductase-like Zn-dependent oxidoreductase
LDVNKCFLQERIPMRAVLMERYGGRDVLQVRDVAKPQPREGEILVRVRAAGVNPVDWKIRSGQIWPLLPRSFPYLVGAEVGGEVEQVSDGVSRFRPGDEVYAMLPVSRGGGYAEHVVLPASTAAAKPAAFSFEEAAAVPLAGLTALQALRDRGNLAAGQAVLINGAAGGVGTFAVQVAKAMGARVTGVCSAEGASLVLGLGADEVIDYRREDFTRGPERYDMVFDAVANRSFAGCARVLKSQGRYVTTLPGRGVLFWSAMLPVAGLVGYSKRARIVLARPNGEDLELLGGWADQGKLRAVIERVYALEEVQEAHAKSEAGHAHGKIVLRVR